MVNPVAGLGGPAGLKGSDGAAIQALALQRGSRSRAQERAERMLQVVAAAVPDAAIVTAGGPMGATAVSAAELRAVVTFDPPPHTDARDTRSAVVDLVDAGAGLVLFVGGDGTARDVAADLPRGVPILGVPAGVKMYSSCFATGPETAGAIAARWLAGELPVRTAEVLDVDEDALREGVVQPRLHALVEIPEVPGRTQARKAATPGSEAAAVAAAARGMARRLEPGVRYLLGPGGTIAELGRQLGLDLSPLGVDVVLDGRLVVRDASEAELFAQVAAGPARALVTVIGGQGFVLGRGNQQLSPRVIGALGTDPLLVVATEQKLIELAGRPLLVDTGDRGLDAALSGHVRVVTGPGTVAVYPIASPE
ncbi:MAG: ATP-NAD kinase family protein [Propionicimonas sp.]|uniref:ATP-NAD kinase family protein n=1 Tax=Propionicimonas sp. TaxID=1955623 RepID=UPI003D0EA536